MMTGEERIATALPFSERELVRSSLSGWVTRTDTARTDCAFELDWAWNGHGLGLGRRLLPVGSLLLQQ